MLIKSGYLEKLSVIYTPCLKVGVIRSKSIRAALMLLRNSNSANL